MSRRIRTRFAPSPTGPLHMGGVRTALYCYLFAKKNNGDFILRVEDTDQNRYVPGAEDYIIETLKWVNLLPNEGVGFGDGPCAPYRQSDRKPMYRKYADALIEKGFAYYAFDTEEELKVWRENLEKQGTAMPGYNVVTRQYMKNSLTLSHDEVQARIERGDPYVIRFMMPRNEEVKFHDHIRGWVSFNSSQLDDKVLLKADGMPTYHLANVVDDYTMEITHVIRGEEWLSSTPLHVLMYKAFGWEDVMPEFSHLPLILKPDGKGKLSKRDGDRLGFPVFPINWKDPESGELSIGYRERGFFPEAFVNMLAFLGWNPGGEQEIFSLDELTQSFSLEKVHKAGARFDFEKAKWFNQQYLKEHPDAELAELIRPYAEQKGYTADSQFMARFCGMIKERAVFLVDFMEMGYYFFEDVKGYDEATLKKKWKNERKEIFLNLTERLQNLNKFELAEIEACTKGLMHDFQLGMGDVGPILRIALAGHMQGPPVFEMMELLGKNKVVARLQKAFEYFSVLN